MKKLYTVAVCALLSVSLHFYLSQRSYSMSADKAKQSSLCHINSAINCDHALNSSYSKVAGIPVSNFGFALNLIIAIFSLLLINKSYEKLIRPAFIVFSLLSVLASVIMLNISVFVLHLFCPVCVILYILSFIIAFFVLFRSQTLSSLKWLFSLETKLNNTSDLTDQKNILSSILNKKRGLSYFKTSSPKGWTLYSGLSILTLSVLTHLIFIQSYNIPSIQKTVKFQVMDWLSAPKKPIHEPALLTAGPSQQKAIITVTEFADFLCSHCQKAYQSLKTLSLLPGVRKEYFAFPLDQCQNKQSLSCLLIRAVYCAEKQNQGWPLHDAIFDNQAFFMLLNNQNQKALKKTKNLKSKFFKSKKMGTMYKLPSSY